MSEQNVPVVRTAIDMRGYARALISAWRAKLGTTPTKGQTGVFWAQYGCETSAGPYCFNNNVGNVKHVPGDGFDYMMLAGTWEIVGGKKVIFQPPHPATWFRSYPDLDTAMLHHFDFLRGKYKRCWEGVELADVAVFARKLKEGPDGKEGTRDDYYTAASKDYAALMAVHFKRWMASDAFEKALAELDAAPANDVEPPFGVDGGIVHAPLDWGSPTDRDDEPPNAA